MRTPIPVRQAIEAANEYRPDAVLLDIGLPQMDGYAVARRLRQIPELSNVRLIAVTATGAIPIGSARQEAGFNAHLVKPVEPDRSNKSCRT